MRFYTCTVNIFVNGKHKALIVCFLSYLHIRVSLSLAYVVPIMSEVCKKGARMGPTFSNPIVLLTLYPLLSFRPELFISLTNSMYIYVYIE
jgi:hypothetical protein